MNRFLAGLLAGFLALPALANAQSAAATAPAPAAAPVEATPVIRETLPNGLRVLLLPNHLAPVATTIVTYGAGSNDDSMPGVAHATEHMLFRGTKDVSAGQFADIAARIGAEYNAFTLNENTVYYFKLPAAYVDVALRLEAGRMTGASIDPKSWKTERGAIEQEIRAQESQPGYKITGALKAKFFAGTPFATAGGGTIPSFEKMSANDIARFYRTWYHPNNATVIVAGDIDPAKTLKSITQLFGPLPQAALPTRAPITVSPLQGATLHDRADFPLPLAAFGYRLPGSSDPDHAASLLLSDIFNSGRGAFVDLSAQGKLLAGFNIQNAFPELGVSFFAILPAAGQSPAVALDLVNGVIDTYRKDGLPPELIHAAKQRVLSGAAYQAASINGLGLAWADVVDNRRTSLAEEYDEIAKLTDDDVNAVFRKYFTPGHRLTIMLDANPKATLAKTDPSAAVENVRYDSEHQETLPVWAAQALNQRLAAPRPASTVMSHLRNGMTIAVRRETASPTIALRGEIKMSPQLYEPKGKEGVADITEELLSWGTTKYDRKQYVAQFDAISAGADIGPSFALTAESKNLGPAVALLADGLLHPAFPSDGFAVVKAKLIQSLRADEKLPKVRAQRASLAALYPKGDPRARFATAASVQRITLDDVKKWYRFAYRPDLTTVAIVGDADPVQTAATLAKFFGAWQASGPKPAFRYPTPRTTVARKDITVRSSTNTQSEVTLTQVLRIRPGDHDYVPLLLANTMLSGEGTGSLLFQDLRVRHGYVYSVDSDITIAQSGSNFSLSFASDPKNVRRAQAQAVALLRSLEAKGPAAVEVQRAKALLLAQRVLPLDSYAGVAGNMLMNAKYGLSRNDTEYFWARLVQTTPADIREALRRNVKPDAFVKVEVAPQ